MWSASPINLKWLTDIGAVGLFIVSDRMFGPIVPTNNSNGLRLLLLIVTFGRRHCAVSSMHVQGQRRINELARDQHTLWRGLQNIETAHLQLCY